MKYLSLLFTINIISGLLLLSSCVKEPTDIQYERLKGKVKSVKERLYAARLEFGQWEPLYPERDYYHYYYDEDGMLLFNDIYTDPDSVKYKSIRKVQDNGRLVNIRYDRDNNIVSKVEYVIRKKNLLGMKIFEYGIGREYTSYEFLENFAPVKIIDTIFYSKGDTTVLETHRKNKIEDGILVEYTQWLAKTNVDYGNYDKKLIRHNMVCEKDSIGNWVRMLYFNVSKIKDKEEEHDKYLLYRTIEYYPDNN